MDEKARTERFVLYMACVVMFLGFLYLYLVTFMPIPECGQEHAKTITGFILGVTISTLISYFWGSSKGSAAHSKTIENELTGNSPTSTTATSRTVETVDLRKTETVTEPPVKPEEVKP